MDRQNTYKDSRSCASASQKSLARSKANSVCASPFVRLTSELNYKQIFLPEFLRVSKPVSQSLSSIFIKKPILPYFNNFESILEYINSTKSPTKILSATFSS